MCEPTTGACARRDDAPYCDRCDLLVALGGLHVIDVEPSDIGLTVTVETRPRPGGCPVCGVVAQSHGRRRVSLVDTPCFGRPVTQVWLKRTWCCAEPDCEVKGFTESHPGIARARALLTVRACWWAVRQMRFEHASVSGLARQLGVTWRTLWRAMRPLLEAMADDTSRFDGVERLGVDEHVWHHVSPLPEALGGRAPLSVACGWSRS